MACMMWELIDMCNYEIAWEKHCCGFQPSCLTDTWQLEDELIAKLSYTSTGVRNEWLRAHVAGEPKSHISAVYIFTESCRGLICIYFNRKNDQGNDHLAKTLPSENRKNWNSELMTPWSSLHDADYAKQVVELTALAIYCNRHDLRVRCGRAAILLSSVISLNVTTKANIEWQLSLALKTMNENFAKPLLLRKSPRSDRQDTPRGPSHGADYEKQVV